MLARILRLQSALSLLRRNGSFPLARIAADSGYADQAHLTREVHALTGLTPAVVRAQLAPRPVPVPDSTAAA